MAIAQLARSTIVQPARQHHADRGSAMKRDTLAQLLASSVPLGVSAARSCPTTNAFSESQFKTLRYQPDSPDDSR